MAKRRINSIFDTEAIKKEIASLSSDVNGFLDGIEATLKGLSGTKIQIGNASNFKELGTAQQQYNAYIKDTDRLKKQLLDSDKKLHESQSTYAKMIEANRLALKKSNDELKAQVAYENAATGSREKATAGIKLFNIQKKQLNEFNEKEKQQLDQLNEKVNKYEEQLKRTGSTQEKLKLNIGNYAGDLAKPFESLQRVMERLKNQQQATGPFKTGEPSSQAAAGQGPNRQLIEELDKVFVKASRSGSTATQQVKQLENAFIKLSQAADPADKEMQAFLLDFKAEVGSAKDAVADLKDELKLAASDTQKIDNVVGTFNLFAAAAQGTAGALALVGLNEENATRITAKLIAVQGIANSVQQVGQELTKKGTIANKIYQGTINTMTTAFGAGSTAAQRFNSVLKIGAVGLVITGLGLLIAKMVELRREQDAAAQSAKDLEEVRTEGLKNAAEELTKVKLLYDASQNQALALKERKKAVDELQKQYPAYFKNLTDEEILAGKAASAYDKLSKNIIQTGLAQAAKAKITEISSSILDDVLKVEEANKRIQNIIDGGVAVQDKIIPKTLASGNKVNIAPIRYSTDQKDKDAAISAIKTTYAEAFTAVDAGNARIQAIIKGIGAANLLDGIIGTTENITSSAAKAKQIVDNTAAEILRSTFELGKQELEIIANKEKTIFDDETKSFDDRLDALKQFTAAQMQLIKLEQQFELDQEELKLKQTLAGLEEQKKEKGANIKAIKDQEAKELKAADLRFLVIEGNGFAKRIKATEDFNKSLGTLKDARQKLRDEEKQQIEEYEEFTLTAIKKARQAQSDANKKFDEADKKSREDFRAAIIKGSEELQTTVLFFLTSTIDKELEIIDRRRTALDEETQRRIDQINQLGLTEQERIKETAKVEKQAAFDREELEKRRRKLLVERAKFEKLANIASIISSTAQAVVAALGSKPWTPLNIALAAAVGGIGVLQLARAVAAPLPQYKKGTESATKGLSLVSEEDSELMIRNGKMYLTPREPTLMEMAGGEKIFPADITRDILATSMFSKNMQPNGLILLQPSGMSKEQADAMIGELKELKKETAKNRFTLNWHSDNGWNLYIQKNVR